MVKKTLNLGMAVVCIIAAFFVIPWFTRGINPGGSLILAYWIFGPLVELLGLWFYSKSDEKYGYYIVAEVICIVISPYFISYYAQTVSHVVPMILIPNVVIQGIGIGGYKFLKFCYDRI